MKTKYINLLGVLLLSLVLGFASCSSDDEPIIDDQTTDLTLSETKIDVVVGGVTTISITEGNGEYKAFSLNEEIVTVELVNNELELTGVSNGETSIVVSDKGNQYKELHIRSIYDQIIVEESNIEVKMRLGNTGRKTVTILGGNGFYTAVSDNEEVATSTVNGDNITINALTEGSAIITITDRFDVSTELNVSVETTTIAYEGEELEELMDDDSTRFFFDGSFSSSYNTPVNTVEGEYNVIGWDYWGYEYQKVYFKGDRTVGVKEDAHFTDKDWYSLIHDKQPVELEILKVDDGKMWAMFSFIKDGKLFYGHFVTNV